MNQQQTGEDTTRPQVWIGPVPQINDWGYLQYQAFLQGLNEWGQPEPGWINLLDGEESDVEEE